MGSTAKLEIPTLNAPTSLGVNAINDFLIKMNELPHTNDKPIKTAQGVIGFDQMDCVFCSDIDRMKSKIERQR